MFVEQRICGCVFSGRHPLSWCKRDNTTRHPFEGTGGNKRSAFWGMPMLVLQSTKTGVPNFSQPDPCPVRKSGLRTSMKLEQAGALYHPFPANAMHKVRSFSGTLHPSCIYDILQKAPLDAWPLQDELAPCCQNVPRRMVLFLTSQLLSSMPHVLLLFSRHCPMEFGPVSPKCNSHMASPTWCGCQLSTMTC